MTWQPDYASLAEARASLRITDATDTDDDDEIALAITAASRAIDTSCSRQFGVLTSAVPRYYAAYFDRHPTSHTPHRYRVTIDDLMSTTGLVVKTDLDHDGAYETTIDSADYTLLPRNAVADGKPWLEMEFASGVAVSTYDDGLEITALWGWTDVPTTIKKATLLQASRFYKRRDAPFGIAGSADTGSELRLLAKVDPDVAVMVNTYRRWWA